MLERDERRHAAGMVAKHREPKKYRLNPRRTGSQSATASPLMRDRSSIVRRIAEVPFKQSASATRDFINAQNGYGGGRGVCRKRRSGVVLNARSSGSM